MRQMVAAKKEMVAVLMTDLVESTSTADRVGPVAAEKLRSEHFGLLRSALARTAGREVKNLGDGLMVVFDSAAQSLACAVAMQQLLDARNRRTEEQLGVRIGVSVGDATVEDRDYFGEPVVEAARLCAHAHAGQIVVNALVRRMAGSRDGHTFNSLGLLQLKGMSESVQAFELCWEPALMAGIALPERLRRAPPAGYVGRAKERAQIGALWREACAGSLQVALMSGEAGIGKTRLSTHLALQAHGEGATVLYGRCDEHLGVPYQPWVQALGLLIDEAPQAMLREHVERYGGDLARLVPALRDRIPNLPAPRESDPETERYLLYAAVAGLLQLTREAEPLLLILDDLHWADSPTVSLLRYVVASSSSIPVMLVGAYRDTEPSRNHPLAALVADLRHEHGVQQIKLTGLAPHEVVAFMESAAGHELDEAGGALAEQITRETAGNPFFAGELLSYLAESRALTQDGEGRWRLRANVTDLQLPRSVREVIARRVERLDTPTRTVLSTAAVIGRDFELELLLAVLDVPEAQLLEILHDTVTGWLVHEDPEHAGRFMFTHALVEHALYEDLGADARAPLHRRIAMALEERYGAEPGERVSELASHWAATVIGVDSAKAIHYARGAAERALAQLAPDEAVRWYRKALELYEQVPLEPPVERCELLIGLGKAQRQTGNPEHRQRLLEVARQVEQRDVAECRAALAAIGG